MGLIMLITALFRRFKQRMQAESQRAALAERARIARDLHDVLAHSQAAVSVNLQAAEGLLGAGTLPADNPELAKAIECIDLGLGLRPGRAWPRPAGRCWPCGTTRSHCPISCRRWPATGTARTATWTWTSWSLVRCARFPRKPAWPRTGRRRRRSPTRASTRPASPSRSGWASRTPRSRSAWSTRCCHRSASRDRSPVWGPAYGLARHAGACHAGRRRARGGVGSTGNWQVNLRIPACQIVLDESVTVVVADDQSAVREGLVLLLGTGRRGSP